MKDLFLTTGRYYTTKEYRFREVLNIKKKNSRVHEPDLMVIMMNPGSSRPLNGVENSSHESEAIPDNTQSQVMRIMLKAGFKYTRILNLSDLREAKSTLFYKKIEELDQKGIAHSIFDSSRKEDLNRLWVNRVPVILAWGVSPNLKSLAQKALSFCNNTEQYGLNKPGTNWAYYHPLPPVYQKQQEWVKEILSQLNR